MKLFVAAACCLCTVVRGQQADTLLLKNFHPVSIYRIPVTQVPKAAFPVTDMHTHDYPESAGEIADWVKTMDSAGIAHAHILSYACGKPLDSAVEKYAPFGNRFSVWCGFDYSGYGKPGGSAQAVAELVRCYKKGARGVGELGDKGEGELYSVPFSGRGVHIDDPYLDPVLKKCAELHMPVSIHIGEDRWMYEAPDATNDGLMNASVWHVDMNKPGKLDHRQLVASLSNALRRHPGTVFIACHLANCNADLRGLGDLFDSFPNLYADIAARYAEFAPIPRYAAAFFIKYQDRLVYGTDMGTSAKMYAVTFRILETADEHFYESDQFGYHWPLYGLNLPADVLRKLYQTNAEKITAYR